MIRSKPSQKHIIWAPESVIRLLWIEKQTFLVFVQFSEMLCSKRYDTNDLKARYSNSSKRKKIAMNQKENFICVGRIWWKVT